MTNVTKQVILDIVAIAIFAILARFAHPPVTLGGIFDAFWPWALGALVGWAILVWLFKSQNIWVQGLVVWASAIVFGMIFWAIVNSSLPHWSFLMVATIMSAVLLFGFRAATQFINRRKAAA
ncbi:DUF3054 domain-containing protein [Corynebacterium sp. L4756]|uniref:DUF3054 domain-containing protein n=1 Tax=unclassified Corynebacterium TaxID=2624378 RepID=UPI00374D5368